MEKVAETKSQVQGNEHKAANDAKKDAEFKAKKAAAAKAFAERQKKAKEDRIANGKKLEEFIAKNNIKLPEDLAKFVHELGNPVKAAASGFGGASFFNKVFGDSPKVGDKITLIDYMKKTLKAKADLDKKIKEWAEKGITVEYTEDKANMLNSVYTIKQM